jgi:hypothetical protein
MTMKSLKSRKLRPADFHTLSGRGHVRHPRNGNGSTVKPMSETRDAIWMEISMSTPRYDRLARRLCNIEQRRSPRPPWSICFLIWGENDQDCEMRLADFKSRPQAIWRLAELRK